MKRYLVPVVAGVAVFGAVTAFAATLNVTSTGLGSGNAAVASCNASAAVSYTTAFTAAGYKVATAPITSAVGCSGKAYKVTLTGATAALAELTGTLDLTGAAAPDFGALVTPVLAADVTGVSVVITG